MKTSVIVRLARPLYERVKRDLERPHPFAAERVGFLFTRPGAGPAGVALLFPVEYLPMEDQHYVEAADPGIGAAIRGDAIRGAMQRVMDTGLGALHVHLHAHHGRPRFSPTDLKDLPDLARSLQNADPRPLHGGLVLSHDAATGAVWRLGDRRDRPVAPRVSYPLRIWEGGAS